MWENANNVEHAQAQSCQYLEDYAYEKIWAELSRKDKQVLHAIVQVKSGKIAEIRENLAMTSNEFNPYRQRLIKRGIISGNDRGYVKVLLPFLDAFVLANYSE
jgi:predicted transcriptional regulator